jgi:DNA-binding CsgD family transcriptional regulator
VDEPSVGEQGARVRDRLRDAAARRVGGRARERDALLALLSRGDAPAVVFVSGPGGIGKSTMVAGATAALERRVLTLDGRAVEPTASGFLAALSRELGKDVTSVAEAGAAVDRADAGALVIDSFERLNLLDGWLRNEFLVALPADVRTVIVGRRPPNLAWRTASGWRQLLAEVVVGPLRDGDARLLVDRRGLPPEAAARVLRFGRGHPLALELLAEALTGHPHLDLPDGPPAEVVEELFEVLLDDLDPRERRTVENAAVLRRVTQPLLAAVLSDGGAGSVDGDLQRAWRTLRDLPFTRTTATGMEFEPVARQVVAGALEIRDPARVRALRRRAAEAALRDAERGPSWDATADLLYLVQNPVVRDSYLPPDDQQHPVEAAAADDLAAVLAITERHDGPAGAAIVERWWRAHRADFVVGRGRDGAVTAFSVLVPLADVDRRLAETDPVVAAFLADVRARPLPAEGIALVHRRALGLRRGEKPSPELGAMVVDMKRRYLELRPALARVFAAVTGWVDSAPVLRSLGFGRIGPEVRIGPVALHPCALDFGPGSVDGWLQRLVLAEAAPPGPAAAPPTPGPPEVVAQLSAREREVLTVLAEGVTNNELAQRLFISERTANRHLSNIFTKLGVRTRTAAARRAIEAGLTG